MKRMNRVIKATAASVIAACLALQPIGSLVANAAGGVDATVRINPSDASVFNDTNGDGLGEFQGFGTSLCWWANRVGYSEALTAEAGKAFFNPQEGLGMTIGRYNVGGGDMVSADYVDTSSDSVYVGTKYANSKAQFYGISDAQFAGSNMSTESDAAFENAKFAFSDADFGFIEGTRVGSVSHVGWVNKLGDSVGSGDNLHFTVNAAEAGEYTFKFLLTLTGSNSRDVALRVDEGGANEKDYVVSAADINSNSIATANSGNTKYTLFVATIPNVSLEQGENKINVAGKDDWTLDFVKMAVVKSGDEASVNSMVERFNADQAEAGQGAASDPFLHAEHIIRSDSAVPGYCVDVTKITDSTDLEAFDQYDMDLGYAWNYDWDADKNQMNVLRAAIANAGSDFLAEAFSNSPPYFMTVSGCSTGNADANKDNLKANAYTAFAKYMADVIEYWIGQGIDFSSADPMNEPYTNYWSAHSNKQEGCHFDLPSESKILVAFNAELAKRGLSDQVIIAASDETSIDTAITAYNALTDEAKAAVGRIDTHTYGGSKRAELSSIAKEAGKNLWMSEVDGTFTAGTNAGEMTAALGLAQRMFTDLNGLEASAWILWNAIDMHADSSETGMHYVNLGSANDYASMDALMKKWIPGSNSAYWGLAAADHNNGTLRLTQKYYAFGQLSRYVRPGMTIMGTNDEGNTLVAYDPENNKVVIVATNTKSSDKSWKFDFSLFNDVNPASVQAIRTSGSLANGEQWADVSSACDINVDAANKNFTATMKANSITTFIVDGVNYNPQEPIANPLVEIPLSADMVIESSNPWNNGSDVATHVVDGNLSSFFDGVENGYLIVDLGKAVNLAAIGYCPRSGYTGRMVGGKFFGSNDKENWTEIFTINDNPSAGTITTEYVENAKYRYVKYATTTECANIAELKLFKIQSQIKSVDQVYATAKPGRVPVLPTEVNVITTDDEPETALIDSWLIDESDFLNANIIDGFTVQGSISGSSSVASAYVVAAPSDIEYFVDCNNADSAKWNAFKNACDGLLNTDAPDQAKSASTTWGRLENYGGWNDTDTNWSGWYAGNNQNISYSFELPAGYHTVNTGMQGSWWSSPREQKYFYSVNGGAEKQLYTTPKASGTQYGSGSFYLEEAATVTVTVKGNGSDPVLSWMMISGPGVVQKGDVKATFHEDGTTTLPSQITVTNGTEEALCDVEWNVPALAPASRKFFDTLTVSGVAAGHEDTEVKATITYVPSNLEYFVDCNASAGSGSFDAVVSSENILNDVADQAKSSDNTWGRLGEYGGWNDSYTNWSGWYARSNQVIEYKFTMEAGKHTVYTGMQGSWWDDSREQKYYYSVNGGEEKYLYGTPKAAGVQTNHASIYLTADSEVTITVKGTDHDPVLSWIMITKDSAYSTSFTGVAGEQMYDTDGNRIQAHGGQITKLGDTYYWIGEDKTEGYQPCYGVHMYSSKDLYNWTDEGRALRTMTSMSQFDNDEYFSNLYGDLTAEQKADVFKDLAIGPDSKGNYNTVIERPKMLYNEVTGKYVMWFHCDGKYPDSDSNSNYAKARAGIAIADSPAGPYKYLGSYLLASGTATGEADHSWDAEGGHVRDMNLFKDDDGTAYVIYSSEGNAIMYIAKLNDSYTGLVKPAADMVYGEDFTIISTASREAPALFKYNGLYYLVTSQCTGWAPNTAGYHVAKDLMGTWKSMGDPIVKSGSYNSVNNVAVNNSTTLYTQPTCVFAVDSAKGEYIYMGDRWFNPDNNYDISDSRYVWLPVEFGSNGTIAIRDYSNWTLDDLKGKGAVEITTELPAQTDNYDAFVKSLPATIDVMIGGQEYKDTPVTWTADSNAVALGTNCVGEVAYGADFTALGRQVELKINCVPSNIVYFADFYTGEGTGNTSEYFELLKQTDKALQNKVSDQAFDGTWGYTSEPGASGGSSSQDMGTKGEGQLYDTGWWATDNGMIQYAFKLKPGMHTVMAGFNEWWTATRGIKITVSSVDAQKKSTTLGSTTFTLKNEMGVEKAITGVNVPADSEYVLVTISKYSNQAPIASWVAVKADSEDAIKAYTQTVTIEQPQKEEFDCTDELVLTTVEGEACEWESSDASVATVAEDGTVTFVGNGVVTFTCKSLVNNNAVDRITIVVNGFVEKVEVSAEKSEILKGETTKLVATVSPATALEKSVNWTSSNDKVATVAADGTVTAVGNGIAVIKATSAADESIFGSVEITVGGFVENVKLTADKTEVLCGGTAVLTAEVGPGSVADKSVVYTSSNENVATVSKDGVVTPVSNGKVTIIATSVANSEFYGTIEITVGGYVETVKVTADKTELKKGEKAQLTAEVGPESAVDKTVKWVSSNEKAAKVSATGEVTTVGNGEAVITAISNADEKVFDTVKITVTGYKYFEYVYINVNNGSADSAAVTTNPVTAIVNTIRNIVSGRRNNTTETAEVTVIDDQDTPLAVEEEDSIDEADDEITAPELSVADSVEIQDEATPEAGAAANAGISGGATFGICALIIILAGAVIFFALTRTKKQK